MLITGTLGVIPVTSAENKKPSKTDRIAAVARL